MHLAILLYEQFKHLTYSTQLLSNWQHAYQSFLSHFLILFCLLSSCCYVALDAHGSVGWYVAYDFDISWSYSYFYHAFKELSIL